jgi:hypothetical protein
MGWTKRQAKKIRKFERLVGLNKRIRRRFGGCSKTAFIYHTDADSIAGIHRLSEVKADSIFIEKTAQAVIMAKRLKIKIPPDIIHLFDDMLLNDADIHFPYLTDLENKIIRYRAEGKKLSHIARAVSGGNKGASRRNYTTQQIRYTLQKIRNKIRENEDPAKPQKEQVKNFIDKIASGKELKK